MGSPSASRRSGVASGSIDDLAPGDREAPAGDPVGPRIEQRDAHRGPVGDVGAQAAPLPEQLLAAVAQRASDHPRAGDERRLDAAGRRRREGERGKAVDDA